MSALTNKIIFIDKTVTASEDSKVFHMPHDVKDFAFFIKVGTVTGTTPTLDVDIEVSPDNVNWIDLDSFTQITSTDANQLLIETRAADPFAHEFLLPFVRMELTVGGTTPSFASTVIQMLYSKG